MSTQYQLIFYFLFILIIIISFGGFIIWFLFKYHHNQHLHFLKLEQLKSEQEAVILKSQIEAQESILKNISREIHDNIGLTLSLSKLHLNNVVNPCEKVVVSTELITKAITNLRVLSRTLNSDYVLSSGFLKSLQKELGYISNLGNHKILFELKGNQKFLESSKELLLFRVTQEVYNNVLKHSGAKTIYTSISYNEDDLNIIIKDDGKGFSYKPEESTYLGLKNIKSRVALLHGTCEIDSKKDIGTVISISIPFNC